VAQTSSSRFQQFGYRTLGVVLLLLVWFVVADVVLKNYGVIADPIVTAQLVSEEVTHLKFWQAVSFTVSSTFISFLFAFTLALLFATLAHRFRNLQYIIAPFITLFRSAPTIAVIFILLLTIPWSLITVIVAFLVTFPLLYENLLGGLDSVNQIEIEAARSLGLPFIGQIWHIYLPSIKRILLASAISAIGLNFKVVIASEVLGIPKNSIGYSILEAKQTFEYQLSFAYLVVAVIIAWIIDTSLRMWYNKLIRGTNEI
jgi:NitT/TauT family transport system permease protein